MPRLLADRMLGRLARLLRMVGQDVEYVREGDGREALAQASADGRLLVTRSKKTAALEPDGCLIVRSNYPFHQAREVIAELALEVDAEFRRCIEDNGLLEPTTLDAVRDRIPGSVAQSASELRRCPRCDRVYWDGSHLEGMKALIDALEGAPLAIDEEESIEPQSETSLEPLLDLHQALELFFRQHRLALMQADLPRASFEFRRFAAWMRRHVSDENELVLPVYERTPPPMGYERGASPEVFRNDHDKILAHLDRIESGLEEIHASGAADADLLAACLRLLDRQKIFVDLCEHHDHRERAFLYPRLDALLEEHEKQDLLLQMVGALR